MTLRRIALAGTLLVALAATGPARAEQDQGSAVIDKVMAAQNMVVLNGTAFRVSESTAIEDKQAHKISVAELPSIAGGATQDEAAVWYEAAGGEGRSGRVLYRLRLTGKTPR